MSSAERWNTRYEAHDTPWDTQRPSRHLLTLVETQPIPPTRALVVGCGTGTNARWLAAQGFSVTGIDISDRAIAMAMERDSMPNPGVTFLQADALAGLSLDDSVDFIFDRGCFHGFETAEDRTRVARNLATTAAPGALWFSIIASADGPPRDIGPPRRRARDITEAVEPFFEILSLRRDAMDSDSPVPPPAWLCLMRKRDTPTPIGSA